MLEHPFRNGSGTATNISNARIILDMAININRTNIADRRDIVVNDKNVNTSNPIQFHFLFSRQKKNKK